MISLLVVALSSNVHAQQSVERIMKQDSTLNNLVDPPGYETGTPGTFGDVLRHGSGLRPMILIPGFGFSGGIFADLMESFSDNFQMYAVTLAGFGGTPAPPGPGESASFGEQTWTNGAVRALEVLIEKEGIRNAIIVGHWLGGTQIALRYALKHPDKVKAVIILSGAAKFVALDSARAAMINTLEKRVRINDAYMGPRWFKTVTRETWDDNNFIPGDYAVDPVLGLRLWREAATPKLHVWVRYLCEFNSQDISLDLDNLEVPTLMLQPGLEGIYHDPSNFYMDGYLNRSWEGSIENKDRITVKIIPNARVCLWVDQPTAVKDTILEFLGGG